MQNNDENVSASDGPIVFKEMYDDDIYACNPEAYFKSLTEEDQLMIKLRYKKLRYAELYCTLCYTRVRFTEQNMKTLPAELFPNGLDKTTFDNSPVFGGQCLKSRCAQPSICLGLGSDSIR
jgi:hypothetical protein